MRRYRTDDKLATATGSRGSVEMTTGITTGTGSRLRYHEEDDWYGKSVPPNAPIQEQARRTARPFHPWPASFAVCSLLPTPYILDLLISGSETSRHYLAGVLQNTLPVIPNSSHFGESKHGDFSVSSSPICAWVSAGAETDASHWPERP